MERIMCNELPTLESLDNIVSIAIKKCENIPEWAKECIREGEAIADTLNLGGDMD